MHVTKFWKQDELVNSPSFLVSNFDADKEAGIRRRCVKFQRAVCSELKLPAWVMTSASTFMHRFWTRRSMDKNAPFLVASACVFLASKVEESPRNLRDFAYVFYKTKNGKDMTAMDRLRADTDETLKPIMESLLLAERALLYTLAFDLQVDHPFTHAVNGLKKLGVNVASPNPAEKGLFQLIVSVLNDSLPSTLCLQFEAKKIAFAAIYLMAERSNFKLPLPSGVSFSEFMSVSEAELDEMRPQLLAPYVKPAPAPAPVQPAPPAAAAGAGPAPAPPPAPPPRRANGPPVPSFKVVLAAEISLPPTLREIEEGELPAVLKPALLVASGHVSPEQAETTARSDESPSGLPAGSGEQNNNNESDDQHVSTRKRSRSPECAENGVDAEDPPFPAVKSPRIATKSTFLPDSLAVAV